MIFNYKAIQARGSWVERVLNFGALGIMGLLGILLSIIFWFAMQNNLTFYGPVLDFLILMGAPEKYIRRQLQRQLTYAYLRGLLIALSVLGVVVAFLVFLFDMLIFFTYSLSLQFSQISLLFLVGAGLLFFLLLKIVTRIEVRTKLNAM
jgi:hypothetical protein